MNAIIKILLLPFASLLGHNKYYKAKKLEKDGKYKEACYMYAAVILNGVMFFNKEVELKINELWNKFGPFDYDEELKEGLQQQGVDKNCEEAGHAAIMSIIEEAIKSKKR